MGIGPVPALRKLEEKHNLKLHDFGLMELNEAFAAQVLACDRELNFNREKLNVNGGAIATGPSHWLHRYAHHGHAAARDAETEYEARSGDALRQWGPGDGAGTGECCVTRTKRGRMRLNVCRDVSLPRIDADKTRPLYSTRPAHTQETE